MKFWLKEITLALGLKPPLEDRLVTGWSVDSRTIQSGDLFFALRGDNHDGHKYLREVFAAGASAAVIDRDPENPDRNWILLRVGDGLRALQHLGAWARGRWGKDVIAVTGSAGKTTAKEVIASMLSTAMRTGRSAGNLNNHIGVPLSLLRLEDDCEAAVLEMGMNHAGEIAALAAIAKPKVGVVTNVGHAHIEFFDSMEGIAAAKRELIEALPEDGVAVLNADDPKVAAFARVHPGRTITFGLSAGAEVRAERVRYSFSEVRFRWRDTEFQSSLAGRHGVLNLLAGLAVSSLYDVDPGRLAEAARGLQPGPMRGRRFEEDGIFHIDDCYNSNPDAARAMIDLLAATPAERRIAVLGEMLELGRWSEPLHRDLGSYVAGSGVHVLVGIRGAARHAVEAAVAAGFPASAAFFFENPEPAGLYLKSIVRNGDVILWKGSRGARVELALEAFRK
jgi:UDP-N-acetylmuramoyl-tripeptide--D-alanyl-D-alanine ligase